MDALPIHTRRLALAVLDAGCVDALAVGRRGTQPFVVPTWWPDDEDRLALFLLQERLEAFTGQEAWRPRAMVDRAGVMVGHVGFHLPPRPLAVALADPSFSGVIDDAAAGAVEIGYTVFPSSRGQGLATEAVAALTDSAFATRAVAAVVATVFPENRASLRVLHHVGGFQRVGTCRDDAGRRELVFVKRRRGMPPLCATEMAALPPPGVPVVGPGRRSSSLGHLRDTSSAHPLASDAGAASPPRESPDHDRSADRPGVTSAGGRLRTCS